MLAADTMDGRPQPPKGTDVHQNYSGELMPLFARSLVRPFAASLLILTAAAGLFAPRVAQALPASCSTAGNLCVAPEITPWVYYVVPGFSASDLGPFDSEAAAVAAAAARPVGALWCSSSVINVTYDDNWSQGTTPVIDGSVDVHHGNTIHLMVSSRSSGSSPCNQSWAYNPGLFQDRKVYCLEGWSKIYDTSVTPKVPFCQTSSGTYSSRPRHPQKVPSSSVVKGNPCDVTNQNKQQIEVDYQGAGSNPLKFAGLITAPLRRRRIEPAGYIRSGLDGDVFPNTARFVGLGGGTTHATITAIARRPRSQFNLVSGQWVRVGDDISDTL